jgi:hypothetical protein
MEFLPRAQIINELQEPFQSYIQKFGIDDIGIFEEEGEKDLYHMGYTVNKSGNTYHIHRAYRKDDNGGLAPDMHEWTVESDDPEKEDIGGYKDLESVFKSI